MAAGGGWLAGGDGRKGAEGERDLNDDIAIGEATEQDREWAARLMAQSEPWITLGRGLDKCREACGRPGYLLFVARDAGEPCGFILLHPRGVSGSPYVASIAVRESHRGLGIGTLLLNHAEDLFRPEARHIFLCVSSFNEGARRLYERQGFEAVGEFRDYVIDGASEILMHKWLRRR